MFDLKGVLVINTVLAPLLVTGGLFFGLYAFFTDTAPAFLGKAGFFYSNWAFSAITYAAYNIITAIHVLSSMGEVVADRKTAKYAGLAGGLCLTALGVCFALPLFSHPEISSGVQIPMLAIAQSHGAVIEKLYIFILLAAILTTAAANGFAVVEWLCQRLKIGRFAAKTLTAFMGLVFAHAGFSEFVGGVYPVFGLAGLFEIIMIIIWFAKNRRTAGITD
jgi:uncharacterized membrane protein YkvI